MEKIKKGETANLDIKKLKGGDGHFRARKGEIRTIYRINEGSETVLISIERKNDNTTWVCDECLKEYQKTHPKVENESILCEKCGEKTIRATRLRNDKGCTIGCELYFPLF